MGEVPDRAALARLCYDIFEADRRGAAVFEYLTARWARSPKWEGGIDAVMANIRNVAYREVLDDLVILINQGREGESPPEGEEP